MLKFLPYRSEKTKSNLQNETFHYLTRNYHSLGSVYKLRKVRKRILGTH